MCRLLYLLNGRELDQSIRKVAAQLTKGEEEGYNGVAESKIYEVDTSSWGQRNMCLMGISLIWLTCWSYSSRARKGDSLS